MVLAWENLWRFLWCWPVIFCDADCCFSFIFICRCFSFSWCRVFIWFPGYFTMSLALHPGFSDPWRWTSDPDFFRLPFLFHLPRALRFWVGIFYPQAFFTLRSFPTFLEQPAFIKVSLGAGSYFLESCRASYWSSKHRPSPSVCLIHSNPQSFIHLKSVFMHVNIAKVLLVVKTLIRSAATLFSNHENIKQQPN